MDDRSPYMPNDACVAWFDRKSFQMMADLSEGIYGTSADQRVHDLRRSVLGDAAGPGPDNLAGLKAVLDMPSYGAK